MADGIIDEDQWAPHLNLIAELRLGKGWTYEQIAERLEEEGLKVSPHTVKARLQKWRILKRTYGEELRIMARHYLHQRQRGQHVDFTRWGIAVPSAEIEDFLNRHQETQPGEEHLPEYLKTVVRVQPGNDRATDYQPSVQDGERPGTRLPAARDIFAARQQDGEKRRKRLKQTTVPSRTRQNRNVTPPQRPKRARDEAADAQDDGDGGREDLDETQAGGLVEARIQDIENVIESIRNLSRDMDLSYEDITIALLEPDKLRRTIDRYKKTEKDEDTDVGPLQIAAFFNNTRILKALLEKGSKINARGGSGYTAIHIAAARGNLEALNLLVLQPDVDLDVVDNQGLTALNRALVASSLPCALLLVRKGADVDIMTASGRTSLQYACMKPNMQELVRQLLAKSKRLNQQDEDGHTALHLAFGCENWDYVRLLVDSGLDLNIQDKHGRTPMHQACFDAPADLLMDLVQRDVDFTKCGKNGETILHLLCKRDVCQVTEIVVGKEGVNINAQTNSGCTPLILAVTNNSEKTVRMLVERNADVNILDADLDTALTMAIRRGKDDIAEFLIAQGCPIDPQNQSSSRYKAILEQKRKAEEVYSLLASAGKTPAGVSLHVQQAEPTKSPMLYGPDFHLMDAYSNMAGSQTIDSRMSPHILMRGPLTGMVGGNFAVGNPHPGFGSNIASGFQGATAVPMTFPPYSNNMGGWDFNPALNV